MNFTAIRSRMLAAALLPVFLVVVASVSVFWAGRVDDLDTAHRQRAKLLVRQVAIASEYGLLSNNTVSLLSVVNRVQHEPDVRAVAVFDANGTQLAGSGLQISANFQGDGGSEYVAHQSRLGVDALVEKISASSVAADDLFETAKDANAEPPVALGYAVVELSRDSLKARERSTLFIAAGVGLFGLLVGGFLAVRLGERVMQPILSVSRRLERIGQGDFSVRSDIRYQDPLHELQEGLNEMAIRLAWGREELEQRVTDVTQELRVKMGEAESATLAKSRFLAAASHDLRQPTHALGLFIARLGQLPMDEQMRQLVLSLDASVQAMQDLLDGLLDISRLDAGVVQVQKRPVNLGELLGTLRAALASVATEKGLRLRVRPTHLWALSDPVVLQRMVMNLANNALRYTERGSVHIACRPVDGGKNIRIDVSDSGIGISQEHQTEIFREFYQVGNPRRDRTYGLGLGLNIVERSARLLGHTVALRSSLGCGTRFSITLPLVAAPEAAPSVVPVEVHVTVALKGLRVWVIEDDEFSREAIQELLESWGCSVCVASTAEQAYARMQHASAPDVIVSDYRLGGGDSGLSAIACLRALAGRSIPACLMSGDTDAALMQAVKDSGLTLLHKPVRPAKLRSLVRHLVASAATAGVVPDVQLPSHEP
ncbi:MAG: hypothetical protein A3F78_01480 [Burkholderiales bacterium RIFCSPLOWO2_12_FULL_61_40]|nr:MAG: hypothetical protein A3F78_01480 [Burkholderiales bacterium RIFCSPLOWO2_12_FULL_61_40]